MTGQRFGTAFARNMAKARRETGDLNAAAVLDDLCELIAELRAEVDRLKPKLYTPPGSPARRDFPPTTLPPTDP
jgi:hypothetical protein